MKKKLTTLSSLIILVLHAFAQTTGTVTDVSGNAYRTVKIGTQWWMAENLKSDKLNDGTPIPYVSDYAAWRNLSTPGYCWLNDSVKYRNIYGGLYNWYAVSTGKVCPIGWHVPSESEWTQLANYLGGTAVAGGKMKEVGTAHWYAPNVATNESGFTSLPGGRRSNNGLFHPLTTIGQWWSADAYGAADTTRAKYMMLRNSMTRLLFGSDYKIMGFSVRCIENTLASKRLIGKIRIQPEMIDPVPAVSVYPNPASDKLFVSANGTGKVSMVSLFDISGKSITANFDADHKSIDVSSLPKGMYIVVVKTDKGEFKTKFMKQ